jgi:hypothetical protein
MDEHVPRAITEGLKSVKDYAKVYNGKVSMERENIVKIREEYTMYNRLWMR